MESDKFSKENIIKEFIRESSSGIGAINANKVNDVWISRHGYRDFFDSIFKDSNKISEKIYRYVYDVEEIPTCKTCGIKLKFRNWQEGYGSYCCKEHASISLFDQNTIIMKDFPENVDDDLIIKTFYLDNGKINRGKTREKWVREHGFFDYLLNRFPDFDNMKNFPVEVIYRIKNHIEKNPICPVCGKNVRFRDTNIGYNGYCSNSCSRIDRNAYRIKYDSSIVVDDDTILRECISSNDTLMAHTTYDKWLKEHGLYEYIKNRYDDSSSIAETIYRIKNKIEVRPICDVCGKPLKFYGYTKGFSSSHCVTCAGKSEDHRRKYIDMTNAKFNAIGLDAKLDQDNLDFVYVYNVCQKHNPFKIKKQDVYKAISEKYVEDGVNFCPICNLNSLESVMRSLLDSLQIKNIKTHSRNSIKCDTRREIDFYLEDFRVGIECNGVYWHQGMKCKKDIKEKLDLASKNNIVLLNFWEDEIRYYKDKVRDIIAFNTNSSGNCIKIDEIVLDNINLYEINTDLFFNINEDLTKSLDFNSSHLGVYHENNIVGVIEIEKLTKFRGILRLFFKSGYCIDSLDIDQICNDVRSSLGYKSLIIYENLDICRIHSKVATISKELQKMLYFRTSARGRMTREEFKREGRGFVCYTSNFRELVFK